MGCGGELPFIFIRNGQIMQSRQDLRMVGPAVEGFFYFQNHLIVFPGTGMLFSAAASDTEIGVNSCQIVLPPLPLGNG